jgi:hypothetical protein
MNQESEAKMSSRIIQANSITKVVKAGQLRSYLVRFLKSPAIEASTRLKVRAVNYVAGFFTALVCPFNLMLAEK